SAQQESAQPENVQLDNPQLENARTDDIQAENADEARPLMTPMPVTESSNPQIPALATEAAEAKLTRRERRRLAKEKKRLTRSEQAPLPAASNAGLPEIILARSEGSDTLHPVIPVPAPVSPSVRNEAPTPEPSADAWPEPQPEPAEALPAEATAVILPSPAESVMESAGTLLPAIRNGDEPALEPSEDKADGRGRPNGGEASSGGNVMNLLTPCDVLDSSDSGDENESFRKDVILFRRPFAGFAAEADDAGGEPEERGILRLRETTGEGDSGGEEAALSPINRLELLRAIVGPPRCDADEEPEDALEERASLLLDLKKALKDREAALEAEAAAQNDARRQAEAKLEEMSRLLAEAKVEEMSRLLAEARAGREIGEAMARERDSLLALRDLELAGARESLELADRKLCDLDSRLSEAESKAAAGAAEAGKREQLLAEHGRLYREFEDLRLAYNEVVSSVMPGLQKERDDLAVTVERQGSETDRLRVSLSRSRRTQAAGYALGAAALILMVLLPAFNWLRSGEEAKELAVGHQEASAVREQLKVAEEDRDRARVELADLRRASVLERKKAEKLEENNQRYERELAKLKSTAKEGTPVRTVDMALQGTHSANGNLRRNEVKDPDGSIREVAEVNRQRRGQEGAAPRRGQALPVRMLARADSVKPPSADAGGNRAAAVPEEITAKVKPGEGVSQVVYRVLGTRDPEVIAWVVRENRLKLNGKGNPLIYKDQELRLPKDAGSAQSASAGRGRR
ncbi:MAG: hypothetical protein LBV15_02975, partial [Planctomycetota bacterium]|nr:hypothetical protein [Planctomycetota bacterium]